jgi:hypothetical protein
MGQLRAGCESFTITADVTGTAFMAGYAGSCPERKP